MQLLIIWCCYQEVVHVIDGAFCQNISELSIDHTLEYGGGIPESERHDCWFEQSLIGFEGGFRFIAFPETYIVVSCAHVYFGEEACVPNFIH